MSHGNGVTKYILLMLFFIQPQPAVVKNLQCNICLQKYTRSTNLNSHKETAHGEEGKHHACRFECPKCDAQYRTMTELVSHCNEYHHDINFGLYYLYI